MRGNNRAMPTIRLSRLTAAAWAGLLALAACHHSVPVAPLEPSVQYAQAMRLFRAGRFDKAQVALQRLQFDLPARDTLLAEVRFYLAETYAAQNDMITAAREFRRVADDFPSDALAPQALLRVGDQYARLWRRAELDPTNGETALATFQELLGRYPESAAARIATVRVQALNDQYARKDFQNGLYYFKRGGFDSAILYFRGLIARYPASSVVPEAYVKLVEAYRTVGYREERDETCAHLQQFFGGRADVRRVCGNGSPGR